MPLKPGCRILGVSPQIFFAIAEAREVWRKQSAELVWTAGVDGIHKPGSAHYRGDGADLRTSNLQRPAAAVAELAVNLGSDFDVIFENPGTDNAHCHVEYDPKASY